MAVEDERVGPHRDAIQAALQDHLPNEVGEGALVTRWVVIYELMAPDGDRWLTRSRSEAATAWDAKGMLLDGLVGMDWEEAT